MQILRLVAFCTMWGLLLATLGCNQFSGRNKRRGPAELKPPDYSASIRLPLAFNAASKLAAAGKTAALARLDYKVGGSADPPLKMQLADPDRPLNALYQGGGFRVELSPALGKAKIANEKSRECIVPGSYRVTLRDEQGILLGRFDIDAGGHLVYQPDSADPAIAVNILSTSLRTIYTFHRRSVAGTPTADFLDAEYIRGPHLTEHAAVAADGWRYRFQFWDGVLWLHPADHMGDLVQLMEQEMKQEEAARKDGTAYTPKLEAPGLGPASSSHGNSEQLYR